MGPSRARFLVLAPIALVSACIALIVVHGQSLDERLVVLGAGLPAIDAGVTFEETHSPSAAEAIRRIAIRTAVQQQRMNDAPLSYVPGRVIVKFRDGAAAADRIDAVRSTSASAAIAERPSFANFDIVRLDPQADAEAVASALRNRREVEYAQPAYRIHAMFVPNDPLYQSNQWNLPLIDLEAAWDIQPSAGSAITVAVLDSGLAYLDRTLQVNIPAFRDEFGVRYPALGPQTIPYSAARQVVATDHPERIVAPHDFIWDNDTPFDFDGHGTHVAGTIGQLTNDNIGTAGVAFNVKLMPVKVIDSTWDDLFGAPNVADDSTVARGIRYAADNGAKVINMSIGRTGPPDTAPAIEDAIKYAVGKGVFIAIAAGNDFEDGNPKEIVAEIASRVQGAVSVAAIDRHAIGQTGSPRCQGTPSSPDCHAYYSSSGSWVEIAAPGGSERAFGRLGFVFQQTFDFEQTDTFLLPPSQYHAPRFDIIRYVGYIGTSMATPHVTGVAAMLMQQGITDPAAIEAAIEKFAIDMGKPGRDDLFGFGMIDARNTLRGLGLAR